MSATGLAIGEHSMIATTADQFEDYGNYVSDLSDLILSENYTIEEAVAELECRMTTAKRRLKNSNARYRTIIPSLQHENSQPLPRGFHARDPHRETPFHLESKRSHKGLGASVTAKQDQMHTFARQSYHEEGNGYRHEGMSPNWPLVQCRTNRPSLDFDSLDCGGSDALEGDASSALIVPEICSVDSESSTHITNTDTVCLRDLLINKTSTSASYSTVRTP
jgi:hypothetical protein